jgi:hypothetical protein
MKGECIRCGAEYDRIGGQCVNTKPDLGVCGGRVADASLAALRRWLRARAETDDGLCESGRRALAIVNHTIRRDGTLRAGWELADEGLRDDFFYAFGEEGDLERIGEAADEVDGILSDYGEDLDAFEATALRDVLQRLRNRSNKNNATPTSVRYRWVGDESNSCNYAVEWASEAVPLPDTEFEFEEGEDDEGRGSEQHRAGAAAVDWDSQEKPGEAKG